MNFLIYLPLHVYFQWCSIVRKRDVRNWNKDFSKQLGVHDNETGSDVFDKAVDFEFGDVLIMASGLNYDAVIIIFIL